MRTVPGLFVSFETFPCPHQTITTNHPQSPQLISFVCVRKNPPEVDDELKSIGRNRKTDPNRYALRRCPTERASPVSRAAVQARREMRRREFSLTLRKGIPMGLGEGGQRA